MAALVTHATNDDITKHTQKKHDFDQELYTTSLTNKSFLFIFFLQTKILEFTHKTLFVCTYVSRTLRNWSRRGPPSYKCVCVCDMVVRIAAIFKLHMMNIMFLGI